MGGRLPLCSTSRKVESRCIHGKHHPLAARLALVCSAGGLGDAEGKMCFMVLIRRVVCDHARGDSALGANAMADRPARRSGTATSWEKGRCATVFSITSSADTMSDKPNSTRNGCSLPPPRRPLVSTVTMLSSTTIRPCVWRPTRPSISLQWPRGRSAYAWRHWSMCCRCITPSGSSKRSVSLTSSVTAASKWALVVVPTGPRSGVCGVVTLVRTMRGSRRRWR